MKKNISIKKSIFRERQRVFEFIFAVVLILIGVGLRFLPHMPNFTPIIAIALFGGVYFSKKVALILPIAVMMISDIFIGYYEFSLMYSVYGAFLLCVALGFWLKKNKKWYTIGGGAILSSVLFFLITNLAVWIFTSWYPRDLSGLIQCYLSALPFLKNALFGDLFYVTMFFGTYELAGIWLRKKFGIIKTKEYVLEKPTQL